MADPLNKTWGGVQLLSLLTFLSLEEVDRLPETDEDCRCTSRNLLEEADRMYGSNNGCSCRGCISSTSSTASMVIKLQQRHTNLIAVAKKIRL